MYLCNKKCQLVIKLNIVIELKVSVTENFIQLWFCRPFCSILLMLFLQDSLFLFFCSVYAALLKCLYDSCFKSVLLENVTDNPGHIFWCVSSPDKHQVISAVVWSRYTSKGSSWTMNASTVLELNLNICLMVLSSYTFHTKVEHWKRQWVKITKHTGS